MHFSYSPLKEDYSTPDDEESDPKTRYIGCIKVNTSMRSLTNIIRSQVATESIYRLCEANNINRNRNRKRLDHINHMLDDKPNLEYSGCDVQLSVSDTHIGVISRENNQVILKHAMPNVSFASTGDEETVDYVAYVAKNEYGDRSCYVLECGFETAKKILNIIRRAFELRTEQFLNGKGTLSPSTTSNTIDRKYGSYMKTDEREFFPTSPSSTATTIDIATRTSCQNKRNQRVIDKMRETLEKEPWFHGSFLNREQSETRLKQEGDFLVRESLIDSGSFVLSVMNNGSKIHILFDDFLEMGQVRMKEMVFEDISHLVKFHHDQNLPILHNDMIVHLKTGVCPSQTRT